MPTNLNYHGKYHSHLFGNDQVMNINHKELWDRVYNLQHIVMALEYISGFI